MSRRNETPRPMSSDTLPPLAETKDHDQPQDATPATPLSATKAKLRKIPPIPIRRKSKNENAKDEGQAEDEEEKEDNPVEEARLSSMLLASSLGLNQIRTRSPLSPLRISSSVGASSHLGDEFSKLNKSRAETSSNLKWKPPQANVEHKEQGKKVQWSHSKSLGDPSPFTPVFEGSHAAFAKEIQSPRCQAILRVTNRHKKLRNPDLKAFSHELNSKGVRPYPVWKFRVFGHMEEVMVAIRAKFDRLKEEVNSDLGAFAGDLEGILEKTSDCHPEWRGSLEDLSREARDYANMSPDEFWLECEGIVMKLDDQRQNLPMGILKQAHTRLLFILTRCSRLVQFHKESIREDNHILGVFPFSDIGFYSKRVLEATQKDEKEKKDKQMKKSHGNDQGNMSLKEERSDQNVIVEAESMEVSTAKSVDSTSSSYKMSSWKKLPPIRKNHKDPDAIDTPPKDELDKPEFKDESAENLYTPSCRTENLEPPSRGHAWVSWGDHQNFTYENSMICRICEFEIPVIHVEEHSRICTIADRCDMKGLTVNERLERFAEAIEKILESWTPKSTPKGDDDTPRVSFDGARVSTSSVHEEFDEFSPRRNILSHRCSGDMIGYASEADSSYAMDDLNVRSDFSCETRSYVKPDQGGKSSSGGSLTPRSPLLTPRTSPIEMLLGGRRAIAELENHQQISKLLEIARAVANVNNCEYSALEYMLDRLEDLKYAIHDRKVDALVVETFGRRIEKLLQEKYVYLCGQIEDEKVDTLTGMADDESSVEEDTIRSLRASPINPCSKDRTSIDDFEIIKPISRGAFGRVFLARKRATGDLFAIKVLKKAGMIRKNAVESILAERDILISTRNPFVVRFYYSFTCRENLYLVMEYLNGGDLYSLLRNLGCLEEDMVRIYIAEVVLALEYMHSLNVIHRDLKPDNLLINQDGHIKLTDFGLSKVGLIDSTNDLSGPSVATGFLGDDEPKAQHYSKGEQHRKQPVVGTPDYLAPEILLGMGHGTTADWWSVGVILFELLVGIPPFNADHPQKIFDNIINRDIPWPKVPEDMSHEAYDLIDKLLNEDPLQRLGATGAGEVKQHQFFKDINWDTLARQKAMFIPSTEAHDTSYFMSRYIWNPEDEQVAGGSDFDDLTDTGSSGSCSNVHDEDDDECGSLTDFYGTTLAVKYSFSNFSFKNLSQLASMNCDLVGKNSQGSSDDSKPSVQ